MSNAKPTSTRSSANADAILVCEKIITAQDISSARRLRAIGKQGTGINIINKGAADARGIAICNTPRVNAYSGAELVIDLTMAVARQLIKQAAGNEVRKEHCMGMMLTGKSIGILGMGAIGTAVATMLRGAFGARVWAYNPFAPAKAWSDNERRRVQNFEEMLPQVDVLTSLQFATQGLIGAK
ncbi:D-3-phosphoglycerate dehydrogenase [Colletotrichum tanaceti]|uniref:D-3-phosphoglycerate dehydrogenase n=1 Tax=Colletotrichum tanaceti TaxID=1306861 RepID=A0A4U6XTX1_9PEZI|nr:D-3-phosphoglycerate dehydrogenase [Colletotrichum tanaceti]TKW59400.1 D-3-phosphoglycerate dehydrogenase [Colletotrichum tanaceti]